MNLLFFETPGGEPFLAAPPPRETDPAETAPADTWWRRVGSAVQASYQKLKDRFDHSERVCGSIRHAESLRVVHPSRMGREETEKKLLDFFKLRYSKHGRWLVVDALLAGAGSVLTPLPGPNIFFFYPAVRALSHYFARSGAGKGLRLEWSFEAEPLLDTVLERLDRLDEADQAILELERRYGVDGLKEQLKHLKGS